ncbi:peptide-methionine (S)-S-oxide reductase MsrA [Gimesia chilikensis]|jgi:methionine-S-sulfoxide reductase|uniref:Peptide methionine sulfoxide reductase MsrA n=1 Tax=Gimesia chilikensis TaxID=2605989 RepID=A0A517PJL6_9PLAN|nr:peptide-methionine (S)-S-oxide reductase MsrA [Gimesia chilikensis]MBN68695.1 peptide-methionine (S)-S-oxide reductase [Gimesia sp.]MCR9232976.1 peptide-methionine (S)-S-oxide reductase MsrA [bacterium]QDT19572.1 Peptide methionine sulfoxide reductase MsrA 2 [Gimesia chilikensis]QDT83660.1 Peptide methionine sulfoxide reductase MsrA 2 [Gimesia chilikensis]
MTFSQLPQLALVVLSIATLFTLLTACENSISKEDRPVAIAEEQPQSEVKMVAHEADDGLEVVTLGSGCFWCTEAVFRELKGVKSAVSGYSGGAVPNPTYKAVCTGTTGHAEVIQVTFDPEVIPFTDILKVFWETHDPTTLNRQGADVGTQYRSAVFYHNEKQKEEATAYKKQLDESGQFKSPIVTEITEFQKFYPAEDYHQDYFKLNPNQQYCQFVIRPKLEKFRSKFGEKLKSAENTKEKSE